MQQKKEDRPFKPLYFIAIVPPDPILSEVRGFKDKLLKEHGCKIALKSPAHITLYPPFGWEPKQENQIHEMLQRFARTQAKFGVELENFDCFAPRVIFVKPVPSADLQLAYQQLMEAVKADLGMYNKKHANRAFHPHMTIANRDIPKTDFANIWEGFEMKKYQRWFQATAVSLMRHNGKNWDLIATYPFLKEA